MATRSTAPEYPDLIDPHGVLAIAREAWPDAIGRTTTTTIRDLVRDPAMDGSHLIPRLAVKINGMNRSHLYTHEETGILLGALARKLTARVGRILTVPSPFGAKSAAARRTATTKRRVSATRKRTASAPVTRVTTPTVPPVSVAPVAPQDPDGAL